MDKKTKITINHAEIRDWVEKHQGQPAVIDSPEAGSEPIGIRIDFPGDTDEVLLAETQESKPVSWEDFFKIFEDKQLAFIYQDKDYLPDPTLAYKFINRDILSTLVDTNKAND